MDFEAGSGILVLISHFILPISLPCYTIYMKLVKRVLLTILLLFLFFSLSKNIFDYQKTLSYYQSFKDEYEKEKKQKITLQTQVLKNTDPAEIEKTIRNKLNLLRPGETSVIIPNLTPTPFVPTPTPAPIYQQWLYTFFRQ